MRRLTFIPIALLAVAIALVADSAGFNLHPGDSGLAVGKQLNPEVTLSCTDGSTTDQVTLAVDTQALAALQNAVQAMALYPAGLSCTLSEPSLLSRSVGVAFAANGPQDLAVGGGKYQDTRGGSCVTPTNPTGTITVHENVSIHVPASGPSTAATGHIMERVNEPGNPCDGDERRATVGSSATDCLVVSGNVAHAQGTQPPGSATGTYLPGANPLGWGGEDNTPDKVFPSQGSAQCTAQTPASFFIPLTQGNIVIEDR